jgi:hypothetical protein
MLVYCRRRNNPRPLLTEKIMSEDLEHETDSSADAIAATAVISIIVFSLYVWLSGMPS